MSTLLTLLTYSDKKFLMTTNKELDIVHVCKAMDIKEYIKYLRNLDYKIYKTIKESEDSQLMISELMKCHKYLKEQMLTSIFQIELSVPEAAKIIIDENNYSGGAYFLTRSIEEYVSELEELLMKNDLGKCYSVITEFQNFSRPFYDVDLYDWLWSKFKPVENLPYIHIHCNDSHRLFLITPDLNALLHTKEYRKQIKAKLCEQTQDKMWIGETMQRFLQQINATDKYYKAKIEKEWNPNSENVKKEIESAISELIM